MNSRLKYTKGSRKSKAATFPPLPHLVERRGKRLVFSSAANAAAMTAAAEGQYLNADSSAEEKEVKMNLRFCDKWATL